MQIVGVGLQFRLFDAEQQVAAGADNSAVQGVHFGMDGPGVRFRVFQPEQEAFRQFEQEIVQTFFGGEPLAVAEKDQEAAGFI